MDPIYETAALAAALARDRLPAVAQPADNSVRAGIQTITSLLAQRDDGTRGLYVHPRCVHTLAEYGSYQYAPAATVAGMQGMSGAESVEGALSEQPLKQNDHAMDATRYALHTHLSRTRATERYLAHLQRRLRQHGDV